MGFFNDNNKQKQKANVIPESFGGPQGSEICCLSLSFIDWPLTGLKDPYKRVFLSRPKKGLTRFFF